MLNFIQRVFLFLCSELFVMISPHSYGRYILLNCTINIYYKMLLDSSLFIVVIVNIKYYLICCIYRSNP